MDICAKNAESMARQYRPQSFITKNKQMNIQSWPMKWITWRAYAAHATIKHIRKKEGKH